MSGTTDLNDDLFLSAVELIQCGVDLLGRDASVASFQGEPINRKLGVMSLYAGAEQLLKFRLQQEHWTLVFRDVDKATKRSYTTGDFQSVGLDELLPRLQHVAGVQVESTFMDAVRTLRKVRNRGTHYNDRTTTQELSALYSRVLSGIIDFISREIKTPAHWSKERERIELLRRSLSGLKDYTDDRIADFSRRLEANEIIVGQLTCPLCEQRTLVLDEDLLCHFCGSTYDTDRLALEYSGSVMNPQGGYVRAGDHCKKCNTSYLFEEDERWFCLGCKIEWPKEHYRLCEYCERLVDQVDMCEEEVLCRLCMGR
jgi:hypothetical protein